MNKPQTFEPDVVPDDGIANDRDLLKELDMSDAEAAMHLGKSRQSLNAQLGSKKGPGKAPTDYFKLADILMLVNAARHMGREFDSEAVASYLRRTREPRGPAPDVPFDTVMKHLIGEPSGINLAGADAAVFILPAFTDLRAHQERASQELRRVSRELKKMKPEPEVFVLSSTPMQAKMAAQWLEVDNGQNSFGRDIVDHYLPTVLIYRRANDDSRPYVLTQKQVFAEAPYFRAPMLAECVRSLLPEAVSRSLRPIPAEE